MSLQVGGQLMQVDIQAITWISHCGGNTYEQAVLNFAKNVWLQTHGMLKDKEARRDAIFERWAKDSGCESD